jgi:hypothetical protein
MIRRTPCASPAGTARQHGQSMIEYVVVCSILAFILGLGMIGDRGVLADLIHSFRDAYRNYSFAISLPT